MKRSIYNIYVLLFIIFSIGCSKRSLIDSKNGHTTNMNSETEELFRLMSGSFSSAKQANEDPSYYDIHLVMHPIWTDDGQYKWLYVEQAVASQMKKPYRQRVYRIQQLSSGEFESKVYTLPNPESCIHAWENKRVFFTLTPDDLLEREGCAVILRKHSDGCYTGSTNEKDCISTLRGAAYATSIVTICPDALVSWDQGWDAKDEQVWGAEKAGYRFDRE